MKLNLLEKYFLKRVIAKEEKASKAVGVYKIINLINDKIYIGSAINLQKRLGQHLNNLKRNTHKNKHLQFSFNKYGEECFKFEVIEYCKKEKLIEREQYYIDKYKACEKGYNINPNASSSLGVKRGELSKAHKLKIGKANIGKHNIPRTKEAKKNMSISQMGKKLSSKSIIKRTETRKKNGCKGPWEGKHLLEDHKRKISIALKGKLKGKPKTEEHKRKISIAMQGRSLSEEHKEKLRKKLFIDKENITIQ